MESDYDCDCSESFKGEHAGEAKRVKLRRNGCLSGPWLMCERAREMAIRHGFLIEELPNVQDGTREG
jgi:hypothetical protein